MVVGCWGPRQQGRTSSSDYVTPVTATPVRGCTPDCLRKPAADSHPSSGCGIPVSLSPPSLSARVRKRVARLPAYPLPSPPHLPASTLAREFAIVSPFLPFLPSSLAADQPLRQRRLCRPLPPAGELRTRSTTATATLASFSRRPSHATMAITFAGKSSEAVREPGLTLQGVVSGHGKPFFLVFHFFSLFSYVLFRSRGRREILSCNR